LKNKIEHTVSACRVAMIKVLAACMCFIITSHVCGQNFSSREYNIKAVFLFNFTQFVEWPANAFARTDAPFVIGILGDDPFGTYIDETVAGEKVKGHTISVQRFRDVNEIKSCHILFISNSYTARVREILGSLQTKNTLTVSDIPNFARNGGMICFTKQENKIKLQINPSTAKGADLNISSKLLRLAEIVDTR
jgi:hypothetical protein